jgi:hypothetical protein
VRVAALPNRHVASCPTPDDDCRVVHGRASWQRRRTRTQSSSRQLLSVVASNRLTPFIAFSNANCLIHPACQELADERRRAALQQQQLQARITALERLVAACKGEIDRSKSTMTSKFSTPAIEKCARTHSTPKHHLSRAQRPMITHHAPRTTQRATWHVRCVGTISSPTQARSSARCKRSSSRTNRVVNA